MDPFETLVFSAIASALKAAFPRLDANLESLIAQAASAGAKLVVAKAEAYVASKYKITLPMV